MLKGILQAKRGHWLLGVALFLLACGAHIRTIVKYAVNIPYWDEWELFAGERLPKQLSFSWLLQQHNEHRILLTRLQVWLLYQWNDWDIRSQIVMNFALFLSSVALVAMIGRRYIDTRNQPWLAVTATLLLSPRLWENHLWGMQSAFHFSVLLFLLSLIALFTDKPTPIKSSFGSFCLAIGVVCLGSSAGFALGLASVYAIYSWRRGRTFDLIYLILPLLTVALHVATLEKNPGSIPWTMPWKAEFLFFTLNLWSSAFGFETANVLIGAFCCLITLIPLVIARRHLAFKNDSDQWLLVAAVFGIFAAFCLMALGRASFGQEASKASRYIEIGQLLIPFTVYAWFSALKEHPQKARFGVILLITFIAGAMANNWKFTSSYRAIYIGRREGAACVANFIKLNWPSYCPTIYPIDLKERIEVARFLNPSFMRIESVTATSSE